MDSELLTRAQIKRQAKAQLRQRGVWGQMMIANLLPWAITVVFTLIAAWSVVTVASNFGIARMGSDPQGFVTYYANHADTSSSLLESLIMLWFTQGVAFTALDLYRGEIQTVQPGKAVLRLFNGTYFFGILLVAIGLRFLLVIGFTAFVIPGILVYFGMAMCFYAYYDGKRAAASGHYGAFQALVASWRLMRGFKLDYFVLQLSLLGWTLLKLITWHLFDFMIDPYLQLVDAGFYDNVRRHYQRSLAA
ncbi:DUF975 family protein [Lacticaseibacillus baoqingensis]|uniref:DUF975 family protein n=1 Tax=Lacticaseibacillus baoqingensis TaxID=2486013 RepID=A0ABW4E6R4_9LACO|nr:DUF975 family protein [Lacticaseibacillus baoqingensis]